MRLGKYLSSLTKPELEFLLDKCNFSEEEGIIVLYLSKGKFISEVAQKISLSEKTVERRMCNIKCKINKVIEGKPL